MSRKPIVLAVLNILFMLQAHAQQLTPKSIPYMKNMVSLELGGIGYIYSLNYERLFWLSNHIGIGANISCTPLRRRLSRGNIFNPAASLSPLGIYKAGRNEINIGATIGYFTIHYPKQFTAGGESEWSSGFVVLGQLGYGRTLGEHIFAGASFTPVIVDHGYQLTPWGGIKIGYRFGK